MRIVSTFLGRGFGYYLFGLLSVLFSVSVFGEPTRETTYHVAEIARGRSWVSPYWGYNTPKIVCDGRAYYTVGLWGESPDSAAGVVYKFDGAGWREGAHLPHIYQPATLALDARKRLIVVHTRKSQPAVFLRSKEPGGIDAFDELPAPADMPNAYYIGIAIRSETLYLAYLTEPTYTLFLTELDLGALRWKPSVAISEGQTAQKPKTAWTYPILAPTDKGLHLVASNCPDGSEGNTYNQVWYLFFPSGAAHPVAQELVAECPMGHFAYATDMTVDSADRVHISFMWNHRAYGDPLPPASPAEGSYHAWRDPDTGQWRRSLVCPFAVTGFHCASRDLLCIVPRTGTFVPLRWTDPEGAWEELPPLCPAAQVPAGPGFMDVMTPFSGSDLSRGIAVVSDGLLPEHPNQPQTRVLWAILPEGKE